MDALQSSSSKEGATMVSEVEDTPRSERARTGLDRRTLIKGAAVAGAAAWTAPVIIDSLTSPAAAASAIRPVLWLPGAQISSTSGSACGAWSAGGSTQGACTTSTAGRVLRRGCHDALAKLSTTSCSDTGITAIFTHSTTCAFSVGAQHEQHRYMPRLPRHHHPPTTSH